MKERSIIEAFNTRLDVKPVYILLLIVLAAAFIRLFNVTYTGLWLDEIYSMQGADPATTFADVYDYSKHDQPPLFFFILHAWLKIFGFSDLAGRSLAIIFGLSGVVAMYFLGKEFWSAKVGLVAAFLTSLNWNHVSFSMEIRFYALVFLLSALSYLFFLRAVRKQNVTDFIFYSIFTALLLNTHYFGMVLFATQFLVFVIVILFFNKAKKLIVGGLLSGVVVSLTLAHWLPVIFHDLEISSHYIKPHTLKYLLKFMWWVIYDPLAFVVFIGCTFLAVQELYKQIRKKSLSVEMVVLFGWLVIGFAIPLIYSFLKMPLFAVKYCTIQFPAFFLLVSYGLSVIRWKRMQTCLMVSLSLSAVVVLFLARPPYKRSWHEDGREFLIMYFTSHQSQTKSWNEDWREVAMFFKAKNYGNDVVIFSQMAWFHQYYFRKFKLRPPEDQNVTDFSAMVQDADNVWLLMHQHYTGGWPVNGFLEEQRKLIRDGFNLVDIAFFQKSRALLYERKKIQFPLAGVRAVTSSKN